MKNFKKIFFSLLLIFIIVEVIFIFPQIIEKKNSLTEVIQSQITKEKAEQKMDGVHLVESQKGNRDWELFAEKARGYQGEGDWFLRKVKVQFYNKDKNDFVVTGENGEIDGKTRNMKIKGDVVTKSNNGYIFNTEEIFYNSVNRKIISPGNIKMTGPNDDQGSGLKLTGYNMMALIDSSEMKIFKNIVAFKELKNNKQMKIQSDQASFSGQNKEAHFESNVKIIINDMTISGPDAYFLYGKEKNNLETIKVLGGVIVEDSKRKAVSRELIVDMSKNIFKFTGSPKIYQNEDEISGEEILFIDGGKKIKINKVKAETKL